MIDSLTGLQIDSCPFCLGINLDVHFEDNGEYASVICIGCWAKGPKRTMDFATEHWLRTEAIKHWNLRNQR